jgi:hypothetical protein
MSLGGFLQAISADYNTVVLCVCLTSCSARRCFLSHALSIEDKKTPEGVGLRPRLKLISEVIRMISDIIFYEDRSEQNKLLVSEKVV